MPRAFNRRPATIPKTPVNTIAVTIPEHQPTKDPIIAAYFQSPPPTSFFRAASINAS